MPGIAPGHRQRAAAHGQRSACLGAIAREAFRAGGDGQAARAVDLAREAAAGLAKDQRLAAEIDVPEPANEAVVVAAWAPEMSKMPFARTPDHEIGRMRSAGQGRFS